MKKELSTLILGGLAIGLLADNYYGSEYKNNLVKVCSVTAISPKSICYIKELKDFNRDGANEFDVHWEDGGVKYKAIILGYNHKDKFVMPSGYSPRKKRFL